MEKLTLLACRVTNSCSIGRKKKTFSCVNQWEKAKAPEYEAQIQMCSPLSHILFCHSPLYFLSRRTWYPINAMSLQIGRFQMGTNTPESYVLGVTPLSILTSSPLGSFCVCKLCCTTSLFTMCHGVCILAFLQDDNFYLVWMRQGTMTNHWFVTELGIGWSDHMTVEHNERSCSPWGRLFKTDQRLRLPCFMIPGGHWQTLH